MGGAHPGVHTGNSHPRHSQEEQPLCTHHPRQVPGEYKGRERGEKDCHGERERLSMEGERDGGGGGIRRKREGRGEGELKGQS